MVFSGRSLPQVPFFTLGPNPGTEWNRTNPTSLLKHKEKLERRALPQWARRELDRCLKLPLASSTLLALEFDSFESMNELFSQDKRNTDYRRKPCLKELASATVSCPISCELAALRDSTHLFLALPSTPSQGYTRETFCQMVPATQTATELWC